LLYKLVEPNWTVLDIGAGNGVLSIPLHQIGCQVTALEPSMGMRDLMYSELIKRGIQDFNIDSRRWEDIPSLYYLNYNLVIASNSLHLMDIPFETALNKVFATRPKNFLLVTELEKVRDQIFYDPKRYELKLCRAYYADTSFAYHNLKEVYEHYQLRCCRMLTESEKKDIVKSLVMENRHFWKKEEALVGIYYWVRKDERV
jgi:ubiquinone/menaquinone biosynthesis C-methylase UbiE